MSTADAGARPRGLAPAALAALLPHAGAMCLLETVVDWDEASIHCRSSSHRAPGHPLAEDGCLSAIHLIEYGAQATAIHGSLCAGQGTGAAAPAARPGMIVSVRDVRLHVERIDDRPAALEVHATKLLGTPGGHLYAFRIASGPDTLAEGRLAVMFQS